MPVGSWSPLLPAALRSLRARTVDVHVALLDASGDPRVPAAADRSGLRFAYRRHGPDAGQTAAIAEGWANTESELLCWLNADDVLMPGALDAAAHAFAADSTLDVWYGHSTIVDAAGSTLGVHGKVAAPGPLLLRSNTISQPSCFVRREAVDAVGGLDRSLHYTMDWDLWTRLFAAGKKFEMTDDFLSAVLWAEGTKTASVSPRRLREIGAVVGRYCGWIAAAKTLAGVIQHHAMFSSPAGRAFRGGRRRDAEQADATQSLSGYGFLTGRARLPVINLTDAPRRTLVVRFSGAAAAAAGARVGPASGHGPLATIDTVPVAPGEVAMLDLEAPAGAHVYFVSASWVA